MEEKYGAQLQKLSEILTELSCNFYVPFPKYLFQKISRMLREKNSLASFVEICFKDNDPMAVFSKEEEAETFRKKFVPQFFQDQRNELNTFPVNVLFHCKLGSDSIDKLQNILETMKIRP